MCSTLHILLTLLKQSSHNTNHLAQIFAQTITTGVINRTLTWNYAIRSYSKSSSPIKSILIYNYYYSQRNPIIPDNHTYPSLIKACGIISSLPKGRELHAHLTKISFDFDAYISNSFIHFYGSMCEVQDARKVFDEMSSRDLVSWNSVMACYGLYANLWDELLLLFKEMVESGVGADEITLVMVLSACSHVGRIVYGRVTHGYVVKVGVGCGLNVRNALLNMYAKCSCIDEVTRLFYKAQGQGEIDVVSQTIMINGFVEVGLVDEARKVFDQMVVKDLFAWNSMINGYAKVKRPEDAIRLFEEMDKNMENPDENTLVSVLTACAAMSNLRLGRLVHRYILRRRINRDVVLGTALVNMYAKCGCLEEAMATFFKMEYKDVFAWTAAITSLSYHGHGLEALNMLKQMENESVKPNEATFVSVLMACSRSGLVKEGCLLFDRMVGFYNIQPTVEHFGCLVDLLSRAGSLFVAEKMIEKMAPEVKIVGYKALLSAAMNYHDINVGEKVVKKLINLKPQSPEVLILVSNFYAIADHWDKVAEIRKKMKDMYMIKEIGSSSVDEKVQVQTLPD
ncbi:hypothetical protein ACHQM5_004223 [Ranunculus cassubicifolius]